MKKIFLVALLVTAAGIVNSEAQSGTTFRARTGARGENLERQTPVPARRVGEIGAIPRAARGNPIQMLNPAAPRKYYGPPQDTVTWTPNFGRERYSGHQITGIILFGITW